MRILITFILFFLFSSIKAQSSFYKVYSSNDYDFGEGIVQLNDSSYAVVGTSGGFGNSSQAFLMRVDKSGNYLWSKSYGGIEEDGAKRILSIDTTGYYLAGYTNSIGSGGYDFYFVRTDTLGNVIWEKSIGESGWEQLSDAILLKDSSFIFSGFSNSNTTGDNDQILGRMNFDGDLLWYDQFGTTGDDQIKAIDKVSDSTFIAVGYSYLIDSSATKAYIRKFDIDGNIVWEKTYGFSGNYFLNDVEVVDSFIYAVGKHWNDTLYEFDAYSIQLDLDGEEFLSYSFYIQGYDSYDLILKYGESDKFYVGKSIMNGVSTYPVGQDFDIIRMNQYLNYDNSGFPFSNVGDDQGNQICKTLDGGAVMVGYNSAFNSGGSNVAVLKIGPNDEYPSTTGFQEINTLVGVNQLNEDIVDFKIYPNPFILGKDNNLHLKISSPNDTKKLIIYDASGNILFTKNLNLIIDKAQIDLSLLNLSSGLYFIEYKGSNEANVKLKLIVQ